MTKPVLPSWPQFKQKGRQVAATLKPPIVTPEGKPIPEAFIPATEGRGANLAYRGPNVHGGPDPTQQVLSDDYTDGSVDVEWNPPEEPDHIVSVRVISDAKEQITNFRAGQIPTGDNAIMVFSRNRSRTSLKVKNLSAANACWLGADESVSAMNGYRLDPGEDVDFTSTEDIWAINAVPGAPVMLSFLLHYTQVA